MSDDRSRRDFLTALAATAATASLAGTARPAGAMPAPAQAPAAAPFDDTWSRRVQAAKHKAVFDGPEISDGLPLLQAWIYRRGYEAMGSAPGDIVPVVVLRHAGSVLALDDALWAKYALGAARKVDDPETKQPATRNLWSRTAPGKGSAEVAAILGAGTDPTVEGVIRSGGVVLVCNLAIGRVARGIARERNLQADAVHAELRAGVVPGAIVQPSGIYATARAQEVGAVFMRST
jgi:hypothetical protein